MRDVITALLSTADCVMFCASVRGTLSWCKHGGVQQSSLKPPASSRREVWRLVPLLRLAVPSRPGPWSHNSGTVGIVVTGLMVGTVVMATVMLPVPVAVVGFVSVAIVAVCSTVYLEDDGHQCDEETNTHTTEKHQCRLLRLVWKRGGIKNNAYNEWKCFTYTVSAAAPSSSPPALFLSSALSISCCFKCNEGNNQGNKKGNTNHMKWL